MSKNSNSLLNNVFKGTATMENNSVNLEIKITKWEDGVMEFSQVLSQCDESLTDSSGTGKYTEDNDNVFITMEDKISSFDGLFCWTTGVWESRAVQKCNATLTGSFLVKRV